MTVELNVQRELQYQLKGRGLEVVVDATWTRAQVAYRLAGLAADLMADVQSKAADEKNEATFLQAESARTVLLFAAQRAASVDDRPVPDPMPLTPPQEPADLVCPTCNADLGKPCRDQRPGRGLREMNGYHPDRVKALKEA